MTADWTERVENYMGRLAELADLLDRRLDEVRLDALPHLGSGRTPHPPTDAGESAAAAEPAGEGLAALAAAVDRLEQMVSERENLLTSPDAPSTGGTLSEKLLATRRIREASLAKQAGEIGERVAGTHERAMSLFVCQFHLANFGEDVLRLLSGAPGAAGYGTPAPSRERSTRTARGQATRGHGGGLFNDAA